MGKANVIQFRGRIESNLLTVLPVALMKPLSGIGARGLMIELMNTAGADSFAGRVACVIQGSTETTFTYWLYIFSLIMN